MSNLVRWEQFRDLVSLREAMDRVLDESFARPWDAALRPLGAESPALDVYETAENVVVKVAVPGVKPEDLNISVTGDLLSIRGEIKREAEVKEESYLRRERYCGVFARSLTLPTQVVADETEAVLEHGLLTLTLPKAEEVKPKAIKLQAKSEQKKGGKK